MFATSQLPYFVLFFHVFFFDRKKLATVFLRYYGYTQYSVRKANDMSENQQEKKCKIIIRKRELKKFLLYMHTCV